MADAPQTSGAHATHDELRIASLLDPDLSEDEREVAESFVATCPDCARLHRDLLAISSASAGLSHPARTRDYRLTAADAARLAAEVAREPRPSTARLTGDMQLPMTDHATHDPVLIAGLLDRSTADPDRDRAETLVATCADCAALHGDLVALSAATRALPTPGRQRDFSLSPDDVERLRPRGLRRLIAAIGSPGDIFSRPLAIGLTTLGLAGLLVATIPGALSGQTGAAPAVLSTVGQAVGGADVNPGALGASRESAATAGPSAAAAAAAPAASAAPAAPTGSPGPSIAAALVAPSRAPIQSDSSFDTMAAGPSTSTAPKPAGAAAVAPNSPESPSDVGNASGATSALSTIVEPEAERPGLALVAIALLLVGLGLFGLRLSARRRGGS